MKRTWPTVGQKLTHKFKKKPSEVNAVVVEVNKAAGRVRVRVGDVTYNSLSSAARAISGANMNGWVYWGLKKQKKYPNRR